MLMTPPPDTRTVVFMAKTERTGLPVGPVWFIVPDGDEYLHLPASDGRYWYRAAAEKLANYYALTFEEAS